MPASGDEDLGPLTDYEARTRSDQAYSQPTDAVRVAVRALADLGSRPDADPGETERMLCRIRFVSRNSYA
jgi:hypothetical protein